MRAVLSRLDHTLGGPARRRVVVVFACVLALDSADKATVGANATQLQAGLSISKTDIGLLLSISSAVGAIATIPAGMFVDRVNRTRLLAIGIACWAGAMILSGVATSFAFLLFARLALGAVTAISGPAVASLVGDYFPEAERGKMYGYVLSGELIGVGFGFVIAGEFAVVSWRAPFLVLVVPTALIWWLVWRLPEPARGGPSRLPPGAQEIRSGEAIAAGEQEPYRKPAPDADEQPARRTQLAQDVARHEPIPPRSSVVLDSDPSRMSLWRAVVHVLRVRTNLVLIVASALGYFFFSGVRGFGVEASKEHYSVSQSVATFLTLVLGVGMFCGILSGGRVADRLVRRGRLAGRVEVPGVSTLVAAIIFVPAFIVSGVPIALPLLLLASFFLGATNPPLDAARLDIMHPLLWGRAEAVRTVIRNGGDAAAPVLFGFLGGSVFGGPDGLHYAFLTMLSALAASAIILLVLGRRTYPADVAAAAESVERLALK